MAPLKKILRRSLAKRSVPPGCSPSNVTCFADCKESVGRVKESANAIFARRLPSNSIFERETTTIIRAVAVLFYVRDVESLITRSSNLPNKYYYITRDFTVPRKFAAQ